MKFAVKHVVLPADAIDVDVTVPGNGTVNAAIVIVADKYASGSTPTMCVGFWDGTNTRCATARLDNSRYRKFETAYIAALTPNASAYSAAWTIAAITDGVRFHLSVDNISETRTATVILFWDVQAQVGDCLVPASVSSTVDVTTGFKPELAFSSSICASNPLPDLGDANGLLSFGVAERFSGNQGWSSLSNTSAGKFNANYNDSFCGQIASATTWKSPLTWLDNGFRLTTQTGTSGDYISYLAMDLKGGQAYVDSIYHAVATGSKVDDAPFELDGVITASTNTTGYGTPATSCYNGWGAADKSVSSLQGLTSVGTSSDGAINGNYSVGRTTSDGSFGVAGNITQFGIDNFITDYTAVTGNASRGWYVALKEGSNSYSRLFGKGNHTAADSDLEGYWELQDNAPTDLVLDSSGQDRTATLFGNAGGTAAISTVGPNSWLPKAFLLDGVDDKVRTPLWSQLTNLKGLAVFAWGKNERATPTDAENEVLLSNWETTTGTFILRWDDSDASGASEIEAFTRNAAGVSTGGRLSNDGITNGAWNHTGLVYDGSKITGFINGVQQLSLAHTGLTHTASTFTYIGHSQHSAGDAWTGRISGAAVFSRAASSAEANEIYSGPEPYLLSGTPTITGTIEVGAEVSLTSGIWDGQSNGLLEYTYKLYSYSDTAGSDELLEETIKTSSTPSSTTLTAGMQGRYLRLQVTCENAGGFDSLEVYTSAYTVAVGGGTGNPPVNTVAPSVTGSTVVGGTLTSDTGTWNNSPQSYAFAWERSADGSTGWAAVGGTVNTYTTVDPTDIGYYFRSKVTATNADGSATAYSNVVGPITVPPPVNLVVPRIAKLGTNVHTNTGLTGGAASGPGPGSNPPTNFVIGFNTVNSAPESNGDGTFKWNCNPEEASGRAYLQYDVKARHPTLEIGKEYVYECEIENKSTFDYTAGMSLSGQVSVTVVESNYTARASTKQRCWLRFKPTASDWTLTVRAGTGTTANNTANIVVNTPTIKEVLPIDEGDTLTVMPGSWS